MSDPLLILIGPRGSGKSTVARILAEQLRWGWRDADDELEKRYGQSIRAIFASEGEAGFRDKEAAILTELCRLSRHVLATGGGVVLRETNRELLRASGRVIWLAADEETLWRRLQGDSATAERRPALTVGGREEIAEVLRHARTALSQLRRSRRRDRRTRAGRDRRRDPAWTHSPRLAGGEPSPGKPGAM